LRGCGSHFRENLFCPKGAISRNDFFEDGQAAVYPGSRHRMRSSPAADNVSCQPFFLLICDFLEFEQSQLLDFREDIAIELPSG
jgi:hypothetical protein